MQELLGLAGSVDEVTTLNCNPNPNALTLTLTGGIRAGVGDGADGV